MKKNEVVRFMCRWLDSGVPHAILERIDDAAYRHGCWAQLWINPCGKDGALFWLETQDDADADGRIESFQADVRKYFELQEWFLSTSKE